MIGSLSHSLSALPPPAVQPKDADVIARSLLSAAVGAASDEAAKLAKASAALMAGGGGDELVAPVEALLDVYA